jgi:small subunit ribosomal protein S16
MLVIRFQRTGRRNVPTFRLVVAEKSAAVKGKVVEYLGHYLPARNPYVFEFEKARLEHWLTMGAHPSDTAARLLARAGVKNLEKFIERYTKQKKKGEEGAETPAEAPKTEGKKENEVAAKSETKPDDKAKEAA